MRDSLDVEPEDGDNIDDYRFTASTVLAALMRAIGSQCERVALSPSH